MTTIIGVGKLYVHRTMTTVIGLVVDHGRTKKVTFH